MAGLLLLSAVGCSSIRQQPIGAEELSPGAPSEATRANAAVLSKEMSADLAQRWGVSVENLRLSAHGHLLDMRYRVIDADKAAALGDPKAKAFLIHEATGACLKVPNMPKVGTLRSTATRLTPGTVYVMLFANRGLLVKSSDSVTLEIGACRIEHLIVQ